MAIIKPLNHKSQIKQTTQADLPYPPAIANRVIAEYDAVVGTSTQVNSGAATHTSLQAAHDYVPAGGTILILKGSPAGATLSKQVHIIGQGYSTNMATDLTLAVGSDFSTVKYIRFNTNLILNSNGSFITDCWIGGSGGSNVTDNGNGNYKTLIGYT